MPGVIDKFIKKQVQAMVKILDEEQMILDHCISDDSFDRTDDDINQNGWDTTNYFKNPVVLDSHDYNKNPVGKCIKIYQQGNTTRAVTQFAPTPEGREKYQLYKSGFLSAFSVGFIPTVYSPNKAGGYHIEKAELLEYSCVTVPCNPNAVKSFIAGVDDNNKESGGKEMPDISKIIEAGEFEHEGKTYLVGEKAGATLSSKTRNALSEIHKSMQGHCGTLEKMLMDACKDDEEDKKKGGKADIGAEEKELIKAELKLELDAEYDGKLEAEKKSFEEKLEAERKAHEDKLAELEVQAKEAVQKAIDLYKANFKKGLEGGVQ